MNCSLKYFPTVYCFMGSGNQKYSPLTGHLSHFLAAKTSEFVTCYPANLQIQTILIWINILMLICRTFSVFWSFKNRVLGPETDQKDNFYTFIRVRDTAWYADRIVRKFIANSCLAAFQLTGFNISVNWDKHCRHKH